jgi:predicted anti-sigma-YlaC factor YlaD
MGPLRMMRFYREHRWTQRRLSEYLDGELEPGERERVERHVGRCPECRRVLATLKRTLAALMGLRDEPPGDITDGVIGRLRAEGEA